MKEAWTRFDHVGLCAFLSCLHVYMFTRHCAPEEASSELACTTHLVWICPNRWQPVAWGASSHGRISELMMSWLLTGMVLIFLLFFFTSCVITLRSSSVISCNMWRSCYTFLVFVAASEATWCRCIICNWAEPSSGVRLTRCSEVVKTFLHPSVPLTVVGQWWLSAQRHYVKVSMLKSSVEYNTVFQHFFFHSSKLI